MYNYWVSINEISDDITSSYPEFESYLTTANLILFKLTGERYPGIRTITECHSLDASHEYLNLWLNHSDVSDISEVSSGGVVIPPEDYTLRSGRILRKESGLWNMYENEICVTYTHGMNPPLPAKEAVTRLATELYLADHDKERCSLPSRVTSVQTQNMTVQMIDPMDFLERGRVGITSIDYFITAVNPSRSKKRPKIVSARRSRGTTRR